MDRATRNLVLVILTQRTADKRLEAAWKAAGTVASQQFGERANDDVARSGTSHALETVLELHGDWLDSAVAAVSSTLSANDVTLLLSYQRSVLNGLPKSFDQGMAEKLVELIGRSAVEADVRGVFSEIIEDLDLRLGAVRRNLDIVTPARESQPKRTVAVFGAGIAGLTAAHELAERGFEVTVYEQAEDERANLKRDIPDGDIPPVKLGGMAASHRALPPDSIPAGDEPAVRSGRSKQAPQDGIKSVIRPFPKAWKGGLPNGDMYPPELPGEHGFRFFPAYYLHIWDMLQRIPLSEHGPDGWYPTHRTVFDLIQRVVTQATTTPSNRPSLVFPREAPRSLAEFLGGLGQLREVGFSPSDISTFTSRLARYLATSPRRRARELEDVSAYEFFVGAEPLSARPMYDYSRAFDDQLRNMPKVLAAFDGFWGDARTNLSTYLQLQLRMDRRDNKADGVLRGPTTETWFDHWHRHLTGQLGVKFSRWELIELTLDEDAKGDTDRPDLSKRLRAKGTWRGKEGDDPGDTLKAEYYVVALDAPQAERVTKALADEGRVGGTVKSLQDWTTKLPPGQPPVPEGERSSGDPWEPLISEHDPPPTHRQPELDGHIAAYNMQQLGLKPWDRYQTLSGLQLYFDTEFQLVHGHVYYTDSAWGLSSINHHGLWEAEHRPVVPDHKFVSVLSVDVGDWNAPAPADPDTPEAIVGRAAKDCSPDEIAEEVWRQITRSLGNDMPARTAETFPTPIWYTLDRSFRVKTGTRANARILENRAPYLVPIVSDWRNRPGGDPWNPHHTSLSYRRSEGGKLKDKERNVWTAEHGGYEIHCDQLVFAGTWTRTFTRMTSMEAACESGRHAVNAILDHAIHTQVGDPRGDDVGLTWMWPFGFLDQSGSGPIRQPTPVGDYCYIFDIENREPAEFRPTRILDTEFAKMNQPHPWELGGVDAFVRTAVASGAGPMLDPGMPLNPNSKGFFDWVIGHLSSYRRFLEALDRQTSSHPPGSAGGYGGLFTAFTGSDPQPGGRDQDSLFSTLANLNLAEELKRFEGFRRGDRMVSPEEHLYDPGAIARNRAARWRSRGRG